MNSLEFIRERFSAFVIELFGLDANEFCKKITVEIQLKPEFGDLSTNAAMVLSKVLKQSPLEVADRIKQAVYENRSSEHASPVIRHISKLDIVAPGFINLTIEMPVWHEVAHELLLHPEKCFKLDDVEPRLNCLVEFVSANPTGPLSLAHGRNAIIGDTIARVLAFLGHNVKKEFYINDAGSQIDKFGESIKARLEELCGGAAIIPEGGYNGSYVIDIAQELLNELPSSKDAVDGAACDLLAQPVSFFKKFGKDRMLKQIKRDLIEYEVAFDTWFSEKTLHDSGDVEHAIAELDKRGFLYESEGALWFTSTLFGDDKDRVIRKANGEHTYTAADIAYHKNKFSRGFNLIINVLGQDHHSFANRLMAIMKALELDSAVLKNVLYQLVRIKQGEALVRMSKRLGTFHSLSDVIKTIGVDAARYFYLKVKPDSHLELDLDVALKKDLSNPLYYLQYAWVRASSLLEKARLDARLGEYAKALTFNRDGVTNLVNEDAFPHLIQEDSVLLLKKICTLKSILSSICQSFGTNLLAAYADELAAMFHSFYNNNRILDCQDVELARGRLLTIKLAKNTIGTTLELMGLSKPESM